MDVVTACQAVLQQHGVTVLKAAVSFFLQNKIDVGDRG